MKGILVVLAAALLASQPLVFAPTSASALTFTFDDLAIPRGTDTSSDDQEWELPDFYLDGYHFETSSWGALVNGVPDRPDNGTAWWGGNRLGMYASPGETFSLVSFEAAPFSTEPVSRYGFPPGPGFFVFGVKSDRETTVLAEYLFPDSGELVFSRYDMPAGWDDLIYLGYGGGSCCLVALDNIVVSVPEPPTALLTGVGIIAAALVRWRLKLGR